MVGKQGTLAHSEHKLSWTMNGRIRLGSLILTSLENNRKNNKKKGLDEKNDGLAGGWRPDTVRALARAAFGSDKPYNTTVLNLTKCSTTRASEDVLTAIAPYIYQPKAFIVDRRGNLIRTEINPSKTYQNNWMGLALIGSLDHEMDIIEGEEDDEDEQLNLLKSSVDLSVNPKNSVLSITNEELNVLRRVLSRLGIISSEQIERGKDLTISDAGNGDQDMSVAARIAEFKRSFRAAMQERGLTLGQASNELTLQMPVVIALYEGARLPTQLEVDYLVGFLKKSDGTEYLHSELVAMARQDGENGETRSPRPNGQNGQPARR